MRKKWTGKKLIWVLIGVLAFACTLAVLDYSLTLRRIGARPRITGVIWNPWWNPWTEENSEPVKLNKPLEPGHDYDIHFDLASIRYSESFPGLSVPSRVDPEFERLLGTLHTGSFQVVVKPILLGEGLEFISGTEKVPETTILVDRLRDPRRDLTNVGHDLPGFAEHVRAARVTVSVHATGSGCAAIALSVWNRAINIPIDYVVRHFTVGASTTCAVAPEPELARGRLSLLALPYERKADAAIHVFEIGVGGRVKTAAVFLASGNQPEILSWTLSRSLSEYLGGPGGADLPDDLKTARAHDYSGLAERLAAVLFTDGGKGERQKDADRARKALAALTAGAKTPNVFLRLVDVNGNTSLLPLGLLGLGPGTLLGDKANLITPMPHERSVDLGGCIRSWKFVLPEAMDDVEERFLIPPIPASSDWIRSWKSFKDYATTGGSADLSQGLVLLAHHGGGKIAFRPKSSNEALLSEQFKHRFAPGSIAVLAACSVGELAGDNKGLPLLEKLNELGLDAAIVSPFDVEGPLGARFAFQFTAQVEAARKEASRVDLLELFRRARIAVRQDNLAGDFADELNEFLLVGNSQISLCPATPL